MATVVQGSIKFKNVKTAGIPISQWPIYLRGQQGTDSDGGVINAVDIDWNGAEVNGSTINTTGELLKKIADLENAFSTLANNVGTLVTIANG